MNVNRYFFENIVQTTVDGVVYEWAQSSVETGRNNSANNMCARRGPDRRAHGTTNELAYWESFYSTDILEVILR